MNIAKDVSELIGQSTLAFLVMSHSALAIGCWCGFDMWKEPSMVVTCREYTYGVPEQDYRGRGCQDRSQT